MAEGRTDPCPIAPVVELVFGRWTSHVLWTLAEGGRLRFTELQRTLPAITPKVLSQRLRQLERDGFVERTYHPEMPPRVEYELTPLGASLSPLFRTLVGWSEDHLEQVEGARQRYDADLQASAPARTPA
jgi:DNA-binding HxlR family transcriptional regulator